MISHSSVLAWYHQHSLPVTPLNPRAAQINLPSRAYDTVPSPSSLPSPTQTSLSVVTLPRVTIELLKEAHSVGIPAVWLQPGSFDDTVLEFARGHFEAVVAGMAEMAARAGVCWWMGRRDWKQRGSSGRTNDFR
ncbi:hypothetical protein N7470_001148 [Penicillium chermesinum]|nr:hypothetical protein N7470_001148 [Penicillium chermesinum]